MGIAKCFLGMLLLLGCSQNYSDKQADEALRENGRQRADGVGQVPSAVAPAKKAEPVASTSAQEGVARQSLGESPNPSGPEQTPGSDA